VQLDQMLVTAIFLLLGIGTATWADEPEVLQLHPDPSLWRTIVSKVKAVPESEAAHFAFPEDSEKGTCLAVGPWRDGLYSARFEYREKIPHLRVTVRGSYRTEKLGIYGGVVQFVYLKDGSYVSDRNCWLVPAPEWTPFEFASRVPAPGADSIAVGFGLADKTEGRIFFADLTITPEVSALRIPEDPGPVTRPAPPSNLEEGDFFRIEHHQRAWWLVSPQGEPWYSVGTSIPSGRRSRRHEEPKDVSSTEELARRMGFNSLAGWSDIWGWSRRNDDIVGRGGKPFSAFAVVDVGSRETEFDYLVDAYGRVTMERHAFPDPFDPRFEQDYRQQAREMADIARGKPWFAGYFAGNEICHRELFRHVYSEHCSSAFRDFLAERYTDIATLNTAWATDFASFEEIIERQPDPIIRSGPMHEDFHAFERVIVKRFVDITHRAIRDADPDHLIFSNRFMVDDAQAWQHLLDLYRPYDAIGLNLYPMNQTAGLDANEKAMFHLVHERTERPIIVGEWSIPAADSGLYNNADNLDWSWNEVVENQDERSRQAARVAVEFYNMPFVIGAHWFIWRDFDSERRQANRGLFKADRTPWQTLIDALTNAHRAMRLPVPYQ